MPQDAPGDIYEGFTLLHVLKEGDDAADVDGWFVNIHEVIAILRFEAEMTRQHVGDGIAASCMDGVADAFADQAVYAMEAFRQQ